MIYFDAFMLILTTPIIGFILICVLNSVLYKTTGRGIEYGGFLVLLTPVCVGWLFMKLIGLY